LEIILLEKNEVFIIGLIERILRNLMIHIKFWKTYYNRASYQKAQDSLFLYKSDELHTLIARQDLLLRTVIDEIRNFSINYYLDKNENRINQLLKSPDFQFESWEEEDDDPFGLNGAENIDDSGNKDNSFNTGINLFSEIFSIPEWDIYISALEKTDPPLINSEREFIGKPRGHKGVICSWIRHLQNKSIIKQGITRNQLSLVLNNEIKNLHLGKDGKIFDLESGIYNESFQNQLKEYSGLK
jgi:hypothetical protein